MLLSEWSRRAAFWVLDFLKGSKVRRNYTNICRMMENPNDPDVLRMHEQYIRDILQYATENVPFYKKLAGSVSLNAFPVVNKQIIKGDYEAFHAPQFSAADVLTLHSSGSTGTPFFVRQDKNKRNRVYAEMMYLWGKAGYRIGTRYLFLRLWTEENRKSRLVAWARNLVMWDIRSLDNMNLEKIRSLLKRDRRMKVLLGYASSLESLANYSLSNGDTPEQFRLELVLSGSDVLTENTRANLQKLFGCPVFSMYSNQEMGSLAMECSNHKEFHLNTASYHFELLKLDSDKPAGNGELGRIVITDLFNHAMPLIRYDTGDAGILEKNALCGWNTQVLSSFEGRVLDSIFDTRGNRLSPHIISLLLGQISTIARFQFIQEGEKRYVVRLAGVPDTSGDAETKQKFQGVLGQDAEITIEHVDDIPLLPSGKRRIIMSTYHRQ